MAILQQEQYLVENSFKKYLIDSFRKSLKYFPFGIYLNLRHKTSWLVGFQVPKITFLSSRKSMNLVITEMA